MSLYTTELEFLQDQNPLNVFFMFTVDSIAQEKDETFSLTIEHISGLDGYNKANYVLQGTILDSSGKFTFNLLCFGRRYVWTEIIVSVQ